MLDEIRVHYRYAKYLLNHKRYVYLEGRKLGLSRLMLIYHDHDKFLPSSWCAYANKFYGPNPTKRDATGAYDPSQSSEVFKRAWLAHWQKNAHHWEHHCQIKNGQLEALPMPDIYRREMLADWKAAGLAQGKGSDVLPFYKANKGKMILHPETRAWIEDQLGLSKPEDPIH